MTTVYYGDAVLVVSFPNFIGRSVDGHGRVPALDLNLAQSFHGQRCFGGDGRVHDHSVLLGHEARREVDGVPEDRVLAPLDGPGDAAVGVALRDAY